MSETDWFTRIEAAAAKAATLVDGTPQVGIVLGSGLGALADKLENARSLPFTEVPYFPVSSVVGHAGKLVGGTLRGVRVICMQGRVHAYEGHDPRAVVFPVRVLCKLGVKALVVTNAAGCINPAWQAGDLMRITDHLNLTARNPLVGHNDERLGPRFPDMSKAYDPRLGKAIESAASVQGIAIRAGVYAGLLGPSYETPAEIRMLRTMGGDAVGMSTVHEVIAASHMGVPVAGISCLTNMAAGILDQPLDHTEVTDTASRVRDAFIGLLEELLPRAVAAVA